MSLVLQSSGGGQITIQEPTTASNFTQTLPAADGTVMVSGNQPAFSAYMTNGSANQSITANVWTKVKLDTENFDTNSNFDATTNYRFTPTVAGYYQINANANMQFVTTPPNIITTAIYKNGSAYKNTTIGITGIYGSPMISDVIYFNGSSDYVELYVNFSGGTGDIVLYGQTNTWMSGSLVRAS